MNVNYKKSLKLIILLITSILIATVSAEIYNYMYISGSGQITSTGLYWELGVDAPGGASITGPTASVPMTTNDGNLRNYTDCLRLKNLDAAVHSFNISVTSSTGDIGNFTEFKLVLFNASDVQVAVLDLKTVGSEATSLSIGNTETWRILFELVPIAAPTTNAQVDFEVTLTYV
jgi:hypothetical protein